MSDQQSETVKADVRLVFHMATDALERLYSYPNASVSRAWMQQRLSDYDSLQSFIAAAAAQAAELVALREREQRMRAVLDELAMIYPYLDSDRHVWICPVCAGEHHRLREIKHADDCLVMAARALLAEAEAGDGA